MLSDRNGNIGRSYGVYDEQTGKTIRGTFVIDPNGYVRVAEVLSGSVGRSTKEILRLLKACQRNFITGEAVPCSWEDGDKTFVMDIKIAGEMWKRWRPQKK